MAAPRRRIVRLASFALVLAALAGCSGPSSHTALVGDSLLVQASPAAKALLKGHGAVRVIAFPGVRMDQFQDEVERAVAKDPDALVILLGANNVGQGGWTSGDQEQLDRMLAAAGKARCVRWINASTTTDRADFNDPAVAFNHALDTTASYYRHVRVVDWASRLAANHNWLLPNDIHLSAAGRDAMGRMIAAAARSCLDR